MTSTEAAAPSLDMMDELDMRSDYLVCATRQ
jgi:hypothetical protein